jgi:hypothetical protein
VPRLDRFSTPARVADAHPGAWNDRVGRIFGRYVDGDFPQFYDPTQKNTPPDSPEPMISWVAFPARLRVTTPSPTERWRLADRDRNEQDEYCEWTIERNAAGNITRVTFTTEVAEYWTHLFDTDPDRLVTLYRKYVDTRVRLADLRNPGGGYAVENRWNTSRPGRLAHLMQGNNTIGAAVDLVARATTLRVKNGQPVTNQQELVRCASLGDPRRNSDPQIASAVNVAAGQGNEITLADPVGLHLGRPLTAGMVTPDGADAARFWKIDRGDEVRTLRAHFEVPKRRGYVVGDIEIDGRPVEFGGQIADRVQVWIKAVIKKASHNEQPKPCVA